MKTISYELSDSTRTIGGLTEQSEIDYQLKLAKKEGAKEVSLYHYEGDKIVTKTIKL